MLKYQIRVRIQAHKFGALVSAMSTVAMIMVAVITSGYAQAGASAVAALFALACIRNVQNVRRGQRILSDPMFYLVAMRHDLMNDLQPVRKPTIVTGPITPSRFSAGREVIQVPPDTYPK